MKKEIAEFSRRNFLGISALGAVSALGLAGCAAKNTNAVAELDSETLIAEKEVDVVIIGSGLAGLAAGLKLCDLGITNVLIIDKASGLGAATNSVISGGAFDIPKEDSAEGIQTLIDIYNTKSRGEGNQEFTRLIAENIKRDIDWMVSHNVQMTDPFPMDPFECMQLYAAPGNAEGMGPLLTTLADEFTSAGGDSMVDTKFIDFVLDVKGKVAGVKVRGKNGFEIIKAKATLNAAGGYVANKQYLEQFVGPDGDNILVRGQKALTGDVINATLNVGGMLYEMGGSQSLHMAAVDPSNPAVCNPFNAIAYTIAINSEGKRYTDESRGYVNNGKMLVDQPGQKCALIFDETTKQNERVQGDIDKFNKQGVELVEADTIEELAEKIAVPAENLKATIEEFNAASDGEKTTGLAVEKAATAVKIEAPKYYAFYPLVPGSIMGFGGLYVNESCRALEADGIPIDGLYVAGEAIGGIFKYDYLVGASLNRSLVTGVIAAETIASSIS